MSNIQLSSRDSEWYTPNWLVDLVHNVIPDIGLDPSSSEIANQHINAKRIITEKEDALQTEWMSKPHSVYMNPPGGKRGNKSLTGLFWRELMFYRDKDLISEAIVMGFSLEQLAVTQNYHQNSMGNFPLCIPSKRIKFVSPTGTFNSPTHSNVIVYVPGIEDNTNKFKSVFQELGVILSPDIPAP